MVIIAFPFAGGDKYVYNFLKPHLKAKNISFHVLEYKGRGSRRKEDFDNCIEDIIDDLLPEVQRLIVEDQPYIIYGHSMGALIGYLMCHRLEQLNLILPEKLVVSGRISPSVLQTNEKVSSLDKERFWSEMFRLGGVPEIMKKEESLRDFFEPIIRSDFKNVENYVHLKNSNISIPIDLAFGSEESENNRIEFLRWKEVSSIHIEMKMFEGNHFFIYNYPEEMINMFVEGIKAEEVYI